jgi:hypothetical protein
VLTDFDGVWTQLGGQADAVNRARVEVLATRSGWGGPALSGLLEEVEAEVAAHPADHGWRLGGRLAAFSDEDPFLHHNALVSALGLLAGRGHAGCRRLLDALTIHDDASLTELGSSIFLKGSHGFLAQHGHTLREGAHAAMTALLDVADVLVCSNVPTDALLETVRKLGLAPEDGRLRVRGLARKQVLTADPEEHLVLAGRRVPVDRGHYRAVLVEEQPDLVVGDVLSMDLGVVLSLAAQGRCTARPVLARTPFTPAWTEEAVRQESPRGMVAINALDELVALAARR